MAQINQVQRREERDPLDTILKGLSIAANVYGITEAGQKSEQLKAQTEMQKEQLQLAKQRESREGIALDQQNQGLLSPEKRAALLPNMQAARENAPGAFEVRSANGIGDDGKPIVRSEWLTPVRQKDASLEALKIQLAQKKLEAGLGKIIPASEAAQFGGTSASFKALQDSADLYENNADLAGPMQGKLSGIAGKLEWGDTGKRAKAFDAQLKMNAQVIGKALEGGKLTDQDILRYRDMLPNLGDSKDAAQAKIQILQNMLFQKQQADLAALEGAGYNTGTIPRVGQVGLPDSLKGMSAQSRKNVSDIIGGSQAHAGQSGTGGFDDVQNKAQMLLLKKQGMAGKMPK
jgi:hypothetical protein